MKTDASMTYKDIDYPSLLENFKALLKSNGLKYTLQREHILKVLYKSTKHLTPELLYNEIKMEAPELNIGIATIYRTLSLLEDAGLVTSISLDKQGKKYELADKEHHDHMICIKCGKIIEFMDQEIEERQKKIAHKHQFKMTDHSMQIYGLCSKCQKTNKEN